MKGIEDFNFKIVGFSVEHREKVKFFEEGVVFHGIIGFIIPTKSFVKIGIANIFCYNNKMFSSINKTFGCCRKIFGCSNKKNIWCP